MSPKAAAPPVTDFLAALFSGLDGGYVECRALPSRARRFFSLSGVDQVGAFARAQRHENVYIGVATRRDESSGTLENCLALTALYVDIDFKVLPEPEARAQLERFPFPPSLVVQTGGGLHAYFLLREPLELPADEPIARDALRRLAIALGADLSAAECARVLRLPGTFNYKYAPPARVSLEVCEPARRYNLSELLEFLPREDTPDTDPGKRFAMPPAAAVGDRHLTLFRAGRSLKTRGLSPEAVLAALTVENARVCVPPLTAAQVGEIVESVFQQKDRPGFEPEPVVSVAAAAATSRASAPAVPPTLTDAGNAQRFAAQQADHVRYCYAWRAWLVWDGTHWRRDPGDAIARLAKETAKQIYLEAAAAGSEERRKATGQWATKSEDERRLRAMIALAQSEPGIPVTPDELDTDPHLLNVANGTLELRTGTLRAHARADLITRYIPIAYDPTADCPVWRATLERILDRRQDLIEYFQRALGYSCTGDTSEQVLFVLWGTGANGKTTILSTAVTLLGDYALSTRAETFLAKQGETIPNDVAQLKGRRLVIAVEAEAGQRLGESLVKQMTGQDTLNARFLHAEYFNFKPTFKIFLATNHKPAIRGGDHAIWRRIRLLPFTVTIPDAEQDRQLSDKLEAERAGILAWAVRGCLAWRREGLGLPEAVRAATEAYRADMDVLGDFLSDRCVVEPDEAQVGAGELFDAYESWCRTTGEKPLTARSFGLRLKDRGLTPARTKQGRLWTGLRLRSLFDAEPGDASTPVTHGDASTGVFPSRARNEGKPGNKRHEASPEEKRHPSHPDLASPPTPPDDPTSDCFDPIAEKRLPW